MSIVDRLVMDFPGTLTLGNRKVWLQTFRVLGSRTLIRNESDEIELVFYSESASWKIREDFLGHCQVPVTGEVLRINGKIAMVESILKATFPELNK